jgi:hypothetical protein
MPLSFVQYFFFIFDVLQFEKYVCRGSVLVFILLDLLCSPSSVG